MPDDLIPRRKTDRLRLGRRSVSGAVYFLTCVTENRVPWLEAEENCQRVFQWVERTDAAGGDILAVVIMPDHVHLLLKLDGTLSVGQWVARFKSTVRKCTGYAGRWQRNFWEHRIKSSESLEDYALYMFFNPYRAGLCASQETWRGWWVSDARVFRFTEFLRDGVAPLEWFDDSIARFDDLEVGE